VPKHAGVGTEYEAFFYDMLYCDLMSAFFGLKLWNNFYKYSKNEYQQTSNGTLGLETFVFLSTI